MKRLLILTASALLTALSSTASTPIEQTATLGAQGSDGSFAPYYLTAGRDGITGLARNALYLRERISMEQGDTARLAFGFNADLIAAQWSATGYERYNPDTKEFETHKVRLGRQRVLELYGSVRYRSLFITAGMQPGGNSLFDTGLSAGDVVWSDNAAALPGIRAGFARFVDIPFTRGYVQIDAQLFYGKFIDSHWLREQYNRYDYYVTTGAWMHYKRVWLRSDPRQPLSVTVGMQHAAQFGGTRQDWSKGVMTAETRADVKASDFFKMLLPRSGSFYYDGNHLGSWDIHARYRLHDGTELTARIQKPWEDGSGIGWLNGFDGVWGLEYRSPQEWWIDHASVEYIDFTNQSGPTHWAPSDFPGTGIPGSATGADDYYNNYYYDGWANYGLSMGTPFVPGPAYNTDGYPRFANNRIRGFQAGIEGSLPEGLRYKALVSHRMAKGTPLLPMPGRLYDTSWMLSLTWQPRQLKGWTSTLTLAQDRGSLLGNNFGARLTLDYKCKL